jgi:hypothetical protein
MEKLVPPAEEVLAEAESLPLALTSCESENTKRALTIEEKEEDLRLEAQRLFVEALKTGELEKHFAQRPLLYSSSAKQPQESANLMESDAEDEPKPEIECDSVTDEHPSVLRSMGKEEVSKKVEVPLAESNSVTATVERAPEQEAAECVASKSEGIVVEEEAAECDVEDPLAMLGGMGEEEVYKVTLMDEYSLLGDTPVVGMTESVTKGEAVADCSVQNLVGKEKEAPAGQQNSVVENAPTPTVEESKDQGTMAKNAAQASNATAPRSKQAARRAKQQDGRKGKKR